MIYELFEIIYWYLMFLILCWLLAYLFADIRMKRKRRKVMGKWNAYNKLWLDHNNAIWKKNMSNYIGSQIRKNIKKGKEND